MVVQHNDNLFWSYLLLNWRLSSLCFVSVYNWFSSLLIIWYSFHFLYLLILLVFEICWVLEYDLMCETQASLRTTTTTPKLFPNASFNPLLSKNSMWNFKSNPFSVMLDFRDILHKFGISISWEMQGLWALHTERWVSPMLSDN